LKHALYIQTQKKSSVPDGKRMIRSTKGETIMGFLLAINVFDRHPARFINWLLLEAPKTTKLVNV
jgi:hypothetical protein